jgi:hypothetical protein
MMNEMELRGYDRIIDKTGIWNIKDMKYQNFTLKKDIMK